MTNEITKTESIEQNQTSSQLICTIDVASSVEGKTKAYNAINNALPLSEHVDEVLEICDCITQPGVRRARDSRQTDEPCINVYLIDVAGKAYFSQSEGVARCVYQLANFFPDFGKSFNEGYLPIKCVEQKLPNGNTLKNLIIVEQ